ncbi:MAG: sensor histidine kinase [Spirochaetota bacterium]
MRNQETEGLIGFLNSISRYCSIGDTDHAQLLIAQVVDYLRYKHNREHQIVPLESEINAAERLFEIYRARFGEQFTATVDVGPGTGGAFVPHYTVMTFVENAVYHAFVARDPEWRVEVTVRDVAGGVEVCVRDNGKGFDVDEERHWTAERRALYGSMASTTARFDEYFRGAAEIHVRSRPAEGTAVTFVAPRG